MRLRELEVLEKVADKALRLAAGATYVRAEAYGRGAAMAWTQPFWWEPA